MDDENLQSLTKALESIGPSINDVEAFWTTRRLNGHNLALFCPDTKKPHDWIAQDVFNLNIEAFCSQCHAKFNWHPIFAVSVCGQKCDKYGCEDPCVLKRDHEDTYCTCRV